MRPPENIPQCLPLPDRLSRHVVQVLGRMRNYHDREMLSRVQTLNWSLQNLKGRKGRRKIERRVTLLQFGKAMMTNLRLEQIDQEVRR